MDFINSVPKLNPALSYNNLKLTPIEGYLLSRIDEVSSVEDIASMSGLPYDEAIEVIKSLWDKKVFLIDGFEPVSSGGNNGIELSEDERSAIEKMADTVQKGTFYQILSVPFNVKPEQVKIKFFELSKIYHPDRYFKKNIGSYKDKLNTIFKKLSEAYEVLYDPKKKKWYDAALTNSESKLSHTQVLSPSYNAGDRVKESVHIEETVKFGKPRFIESDRSADIEETVQFEKLQSIEPTMEQRIALIKGKLDKNMLDQALKEVGILKNVKDSRIPLLIADYYLKHNDLLNAKDYTQMALEYDTNNIKAHEMLGDIYMKFKLYRNALKVYETIKKIEPANSRAEIMINKIKSLIED
jgi:tetratricopeptide (TPR) repeat protein